MVSSFAEYITLIRRIAPRLLDGLKITFEVSAAAILFGFVVAVLITLVRQSKLKPLKGLAEFFVSLMRGTPVLVQLFVVFYSVSALGLQIPIFMIGVLALGMNSGAFLAEILRAGIQAVPKGQWESAEAMGMTQIQTFFRIIFPQVLINVLPSMISEFINVVKMSPLVSTIAIVDLTRSSQQVIATTSKPVPIYLTMAFMYLGINLLLELLILFSETRLVKFKTSSH